MIKILSTNISEKKGTIKLPVNNITINELGVVNDAHAGPWNRQVSMLGTDSISKFETSAGRKIHYGEFAENLTTEGMKLYHTQPLDRFVFGDVVLEVTQIGKGCHGEKCAIYREVGDCVMPKEGIFCRVITPGNLQPEDTGLYQPRVFKAMVITLSDRASRGEYEDLSGPAVENRLREYFNSNTRQLEIRSEIIPDDARKLKHLMKEAATGADFIFTTGGTGIGARDITPETVRPLLDREIPGIMEAIRVKYGMENPAALVSRGIAGLMGNCFVFTLPGSLRAVKEYMDEITKGLLHMVYMLHGIEVH
jgi:molybdopterin adenylyltransferase